MPAACAEPDLMAVHRVSQHCKKGPSMKYARAAVCGTARWGIVDGDTIQLMDDAPYGGGEVTDSRHALTDVRLLAPAVPSKIFCLGKNYRDHRAEMGYEHDGAPSVFMKGSTTIIGPG